MEVEIATKPSKGPGSVRAIHMRELKQNIEDIIYNLDRWSSQCHGRWRESPIPRTEPSSPWGQKIQRAGAIIARKESHAVSDRIIVEGS